MMNKQVLTNIVAGIAGGILVLLGQHWTRKEIASTPYIQKESYAQQVNHKNVNIKAGRQQLSFDFSEAAAVAMPAVVHIKATATQAAARQPSSQNNPFRFFFGDDYFDQFFQLPFDDFYAPRQGTGSGVIYTQNGYIVTNNHVIEFADDIEVTLHDNRKYAAKVIGTYPEADLAVLKIEGENFPELRLANSDLAEVGQWVLAVGNPFDLTSTVTAGIISAKGRDIDIIQGNSPIESFIQTDAAVNPGNSGGALVDAAGRLLGINTAISTRTGVFEGYSFAIPVNIMTNIVDEIIKNGTYERAFLGVDVEELDATYAKELGVTYTQGVVVAEVLPGGGAVLAGILPRDIIRKVDGEEITSAPMLQDIISRKKPNEVVRLTILRQNQTFEVEVRLRAGK